LTPTCFLTGVRDGTDRLRGVVLGVTNPRHDVAAFFDDNAAHLVEQGGLVFSAKQRPVACTQRAQNPIDALQFLGSVDRART